MKKLIILALLGFAAFKGYEMYQAKNASKPENIYWTFVDHLLAGEHDAAARLIDGPNAPWQLDEQKKYYQYASQALILQPVHKNSMKVLSQEFSADHKTVKIKMHQTIKGGTARATSPRSIEFLEKTHDVTLIEKNGEWKISDFKWAMDGQLEGNRIDWSGLK